VYLKDVREGPAAKSALLSLLSQPLARARASHPHAGIVVKQGTYTFIELARWRDALDPFLEPPSVQWFGIDNARNRIVIGVLVGADTQAIVAMAADLAIPAGALRFEETGPIRYEQASCPPSCTLQDSIRPVKGGIRLERVLSADPDSLLDCTLGFLALWGGQHAFVTNSHCSTQRFVLDSSKQYQNRAPFTPPESLSISSIGFEVADSSMLCNPRAPTPCSYADAAVYRATLGPGDWYFQRIARPVSGCLPSCTPPVLTIDPDPTRFWSIVRTEPNILVNQLVSKIGQHTGWTQGYVRYFPIKVLSPAIYLDQALADYGSHGGDSGAPILLDILGGTDTTVTLGGIHWGRGQGPPPDTVTYAIFSPWSGILQMYPGLRVN